MTRRQLRRLTWAWLPLLLQITAATAAADGTQSASDVVVLEAMLLPSQQKILEKKGRVFFEITDPSSQRLSAVAFKVNATPSVIWPVIKEFDSYPQWVDGVIHTEVYQRTGQDIFVEFQVEHWLIGQLTYSVKHTYAWPDSHTGTFELDSSRASDLKSASGFWHTFPVPGDPAATNVVYAAQLEPSKGLAKWFRNRFAKAGLKSATEWLTREAQARAIPHTPD